MPSSRIGAAADVIRVAAPPCGVGGLYAGQVGAAGAKLSHAVTWQDRVASRGGARGHGAYQGGELTCIAALVLGQRPTQPDCGADLSFSWT
jgi:hypothetical protein